MLVHQLTSILSPNRALGRRGGGGGRDDRRRERETERRDFRQTEHHRQQIFACLQACQRNSSFRAGSVGPPFGLHPQKEQADPARPLQREKDSVLPKFPQGKVWEQCALFERKSFTSSPARSWPCFQKVPSSPSLTEGGTARPGSPATPVDSRSCAEQRLSKQRLLPPSRPSPSRRVWQRLLPSLSFLLILGSDQNSAFSRVTGAQRSSECQMPG